MRNGEKIMRRGANRWELSVKALKLITGAVMVFIAAVTLVFSLIHLAKNVDVGDPVHAFELFISDALLVIIMLKIAKTLFTYVENEEMYLHSIMEAAFIAVLRQVIIMDVRGSDWPETLSIAALIPVMGFVYYRLFNKN